MVRATTSDSDVIREEERERARAKSRLKIPINIVGNKSIEKQLIHAPLKKVLKLHPILFTILTV